MQGGFMNNNSSQNYTNSQTKKSSQTLRPVTLKQIMSLATSPTPDAPLQLNGEELSLVKFVGCVRRVNDSGSTSILYVLEDATWSIECRHYNATESIPENVYVKVVGQIKNGQNGKRTCNVFKISPLESSNQVTHHYLECMYVHLKLSKPQAQTNHVAVSGGGGNFNGLDLPGKIVAVIKQQGTTSAGLAKVRIEQEMLNNGHHSKQEVRAAMEQMTMDGMLYNTVDDDHVQTTC